MDTTVCGQNSYRNKVIAEINLIILNIITKQKLCMLRVKYSTVNDTIRFCIPLQNLFNIKINKLLAQVLRCT